MAMQQPPPLSTEAGGIMRTPSQDESDPMDAFSHLSVGPSTASDGAAPTPGSTDASVSSAPPSSKKEAEAPKYKKGEAVCYTSNNKSCKASIVKVHLDDELEPFYTIHLESGKEKQTDDAHLSPLDPLYEKIAVSLLSLSSGQLQQVDELVTRLVNSMPSTSQPNGYADSKIPSPPNTGPSMSTLQGDLASVQVGAAPSSAPQMGQQQLPQMGRQQQTAMGQMGQQLPSQANNQQVGAVQSAPSIQASEPTMQHTTQSMGQISQQQPPQMNQQQPTIALPQMNGQQQSSMGQPTMGTSQMNQQQPAMGQSSMGAPQINQQKPTTGQPSIGTPQMNQQPTMGQPSMGAPQMNQQQLSMGQTPQPQMQQGGFGNFGQTPPQMGAPPAQVQMNQMQQPGMGHQQQAPIQMQPGTGQQQPPNQMQPGMGQQQPTQMQQPPQQPLPQQQQMMGQQQPPQMQPPQSPQGNPFDMY